MSQRTRVYRVVTETPEGSFWHCAWCHKEAKDAAPTWDAAVDALMDAHTPECKPYQLWIKSLKKRQPAPVTPQKRVQKKAPNQYTLF